MGAEEKKKYYSLSTPLNKTMSTVRNQCKGHGNKNETLRPNCVHCKREKATDRLMGFNVCRGCLESILSPK